MEGLTLSGVKHNHSFRPIIYDWKYLRCVRISSLYSYFNLFSYFTLCLFNGNCWGELIFSCYEGEHFVFWHFYMLCRFPLNFLYYAIFWTLSLFDVLSSFYITFCTSLYRKYCIEACLQAEMQIFPYFDSTLALYAEGVFGSIFATSL